MSTAKIDTICDSDLAQYFTVLSSLELGLPSVGVLQGQIRSRSKMMTIFGTLYLVALVAAFRRASHSPAVKPVSNFFGSAARATAFEMVPLYCESGRRGASKFGRVKKTRDQRSNLTCSLGGGLGPLCQLRQGQSGGVNVHHAVDVRAQDPSAKEVERVADVADNVAFERLRRRQSSSRYVSGYETDLHVLPSFDAWYENLQSTETVMEECLCDGSRRFCEERG